MEFGNQIEYVMSYSIHKHEATLKMEFEAILGGGEFICGPPKWNDTVAVENVWISETENPSQNKTTDKLQNFGSTDLIRGGPTILRQLAKYHVL